MGVNEPTVSGVKKLGNNSNANSWQMPWTDEDKPAAFAKQ
jgi:hypothetical protein